MAADQQKPKWALGWGRGSHVKRVTQGGLQKFELDPLRTPIWAWLYIDLALKKCYKIKPVVKLPITNLCCKRTNTFLWRARRNKDILYYLEMHNFHTLTMCMRCQYMYVPLSFLLGKTHTLMSNDGISVHVVEKLFKRIHLDKYHDYKVNKN